MQLNSCCKLKQRFTIPLLFECLYFYQLLFFSPLSLAKGEGKWVKHCDQLFDVLWWWNFQLLVENPMETGFSLGEEPKTINATREYTTRTRLLPGCPFNLKGLLLRTALQTERFCDSDPAQKLLGNTRSNSIPTILWTSLCNLDFFFFIVLYVRKWDFIALESLQRKYTYPDKQNEMLK